MPASLEDCRLRYVKYMQNKYHFIEDNNARLGETIIFKKRYTSLLLIKIYRDEVERQHEIIASGQRHLQIMANRSSKKYSPTTIQALFDPDDDGTIPKTVVLQGPAGIGKTMTTQKIMLDWASGDLYKDKFQFVFYISCREVNTISGKISLAGYISSFCLLKCPSELLRSIFIKERIIFIVDGFDELKWSLMNDTEVCDDPFQEVSKEILLNSLFRKTILKDSSLIITTRPFSLMKLKDSVECTRYVEILGFTEKDLEEYFYNFFETKEQADMVLRTIKDNYILFTMCAVPITCWIVCTVMKPLLKQGLHVIASKTSTSIYLLYLKSLIKYHGRDSTQPIDRCIKKLCALANEGIWDQRILFEESDLDRHKLSMSEVESVFLNENIFQRDIETCTCYSFIHLSVQEFFAALYYVLDEKSVKALIVSLKNKKVKSLLKASEDQTHLKLTVQFLFGLSAEKQNHKTLKGFGCTMPFSAKPVLEKWVKKNKSDYHNEILGCLYETQDEDYVERMMPHFPHVKLKSPHHDADGEQENIDCRAVAYCLERSTTKHMVTFEDYTIGPKTQRVIFPALYKCSKLRFMGCRFPVTEENVNQAGSSLLRLFKQCQMQDLDLSYCKLTPPCCDDLRMVIIVSRTLVRLDLSWNNLQDCGVKLLCDGLIHPACSLQELTLSYGKLTSSCCDDLRTVIIENRSLVRLDLSWNNLQVSGIKSLCEGLRHPACTLQDLTLQSCGMTSFCCDDLRTVIIKNQSLITLNMMGNNLQDHGVTRLCEGLRHPGCTLQELSLVDCNLTPSCCEDLGSVFRNNTLVKLDLSLNKLQDSGVIDLCGGLKDPACTLQTLLLCNCELTRFCCEELSSVISTNRSLTKLDLSWNKLQDSGAKHLYKGLRRPGRNLRELGLIDCGLTSSCCDDLHSAINKKRTLVLLRLTGNTIQEAVLTLLSERFSMVSSMMEPWMSVNFRKAMLKRLKLKQIKGASS